MIGNRHTHQWSSDLMLWQCENFWIIRKPQIMTLRLLMWKGSVMISPSSQGQLMEIKLMGNECVYHPLCSLWGCLSPLVGGFFLGGGAGRWNRVVGAPILLRSSTRPPTFPSRRSWGSHSWHCDQYHHHQHHQRDNIPNRTLVISFEEDRLFFVNNLPYFFPRSKSISKVS